MKHSISRHFLACFASAAALVTALSAGPAAAQCAPATPGVGDTVTCAGFDANGFSSSADNITVDVNGGATVQNPGGDAVNVDGLADTIDNRGFMDGDDEGIQIGGADSFVFNRNGATIEGGDNGVQIEGDRTELTNFNGGRIEGGDRGIEAEDASGVVIINAGEILGLSSDGIRTCDGATISNTVNGSIIGGDDGVQVGSNVTITNRGSITATADQMGGGSSEAITGGDDVSLRNFGAITARDDVFQTGLNADVVNSGVL
ncbi:MAG: hypothetical protein GC152_14705 [Alphaproteobacteria bacterium]|nr:hypothetical protein [Alphaproteobacteria bacterium]